MLKMFLSKTNVNSAPSKNMAKEVDRTLAAVHQKQGYSPGAVILFFILALPLKSEGKK